MLAVKLSKIFEKFTDERALLPGLFLFAFGLRLLYLNEIESSPLFKVPIVDSKTYADHAVEIARGDWLGSNPFWQAPLYPYLLAIMYALFGEGYYLPRLAQFAMGSFSCVLVYLIARRIFNRGVGVVASLMTSAYGIFIYFEGELLATALVILLDLIAILLLLRAGEAPGVKRWLGAGLVLGLSAIARPTVLLFVPLALVWIWLVGRAGRRETGPLISLMPSSPPRLITQIPHPSPRSPENPLVGIAWKRLILWTGCFCLGVILVVSVVTLRNYIVGGDFVLISSNAGINFYIGNNPDYNRTVGIRPGPDWEKLVAMPVVEGITKPSQRSHFFLSKSWRFIKEEPLEYLGLLLKKLRLFWNGDEIKRNSNIYFSRRYSSLLSALLWKRGLAFPFGLICPLSLVGIILCLRRWRKVLLLLLFILAYMISVVLFFVCARYRAPVIPFLIIFAAYTVWWWSQRIKNRHYRPLVFSLLLFLAFSLGSNLGAGKMAAADDPEIHYHLGHAYGERGMHARAISEYEKVLELDSKHIRARNNLAAAYAQRGMYDKAISEYRKALEVEPEDVHIHYNIAGVYARKEAYDEAVVHYKKAIQAKPSGWIAKAHFSLAHAYSQQGMIDEAIAEYERAIKADSGYVKAHYNLGIAYGQKGMYNEAIAEYERVIQLKPDHAEARNNLGITYAQIGMLDRAIEEFKKAIVIRPNYADVHCNLAAVYEEKRMYDEAIAEYKEVLKIKPDYEKANYNLSLLYQRKIRPRDFTGFSKPRD